MTVSTPLRAFPYRDIRLRRSVSASSSSTSREQPETLPTRRTHRKVRNKDIILTNPYGHSILHLFELCIAGKYRDRCTFEARLRRNIIHISVNPKRLTDSIMHKIGQRMYITGTSE